MAVSMYKTYSTYVYTQAVLNLNQEHAITRSLILTQKGWGWGWSANRLSWHNSCESQVYSGILSTKTSYCRHWDCLHSSVVLQLKGQSLPTIEMTSFYTLQLFRPQDGWSFSPSGWCCTRDWPFYSSFFMLSFFTQMCRTSTGLSFYLWYVQSRDLLAVLFNIFMPSLIQDIVAIGIGAGGYFCGAVSMAAYASQFPPIQSPAGATSVSVTVSNGSYMIVYT